MANIHTQATDDVDHQMNLHQLCPVLDLSADVDLGGRKLVCLVDVLGWWLTDDWSVVLVEDWKMDDPIGPVVGWWMPDDLGDVLGFGLGAERMIEDLLAVLYCMGGLRMDYLMDSLNVVDGWVPGSLLDVLDWHKVCEEKWLSTGWNIIKECDLSRNSPWIDF